MSKRNSNHVVACIPYYRCQRYVRRAVESLLAQTHHDLTVVVVNDADFETPPWPVLADIRDPRLIRFDLHRNHGGPFFADSVVLQASDAPLFLIQEQDDWSEPERIAVLHHLLITDRADAAVSGQHFYQTHAPGTTHYDGLRWQNPINTRCTPCDHHRSCRRCFVDTQLTTEYRYRAPHTGLFRAETLRRIGGYYVGLRMHYDTLLMNLVMMVGRVAHTRSPLYHRLLHTDSLTHGANREPLSQVEYQLSSALYDRAFAYYQCFLCGKISSGSLLNCIRNVCRQNISPADWLDLHSEITRLRKDTGFKARMLSTL